MGPTKPNKRTALRVGEVAERSNAADCKSVALVASEVRILPSPPMSIVEVSIVDLVIDGRVNRKSAIDNRHSFLRE